MSEAADWINLKGKVAHVTGGGKGIGRAIATALSMAGAKVMVSDINEESAEETAIEIDGSYLQLDVSKSEAVYSAFSETESIFGGIDILVNNAGLYEGYGGPIENISDEKWRALWSVNVDGVFYCCRTAAEIMKRRGGGKIINVSSTQARTPGVGVSYDGSKAAVEMMTKTLALELAPFNINVNALAPGPTWVRDGVAPPISAQNQFNDKDPLSRAVGNRIERLPLGHWGDPMEQGKAAVFLASEMSAFITGAYLPCDGGWLAL
ncbi:MAG: SDR family oxidoreductase [Pseudomonadota bacterium]|nr:SDR family oxidoreductase [Pseudomonadota bacterium]